MVSTYSPALRLELMATGDQSGTWGVTTNGNLGTLLEQSITGYAAIAQGDVANLTLTTTNGSSDQARNAVIKITGALTAARNVVVQTPNKVYIVVNGTTGGFDLTFKTAGGTGVAVPMGATALIYSDGVNVLSVNTTGIAGTIIGSTFTQTWVDPGAAVGPTFKLFRDSASPAVSDLIGKVEWDGRDSAAAVQEYANIGVTVTDPTAASEDASMSVKLVSAGTLGEVLGLVAGTTTNTYVDAGALVGPTHDLFRDSASPAALDLIGKVKFSGRDSAGNIEEYANIYVRIDDPTNGSEDATIFCFFMAAGSNAALAWSANATGFTAGGTITYTKGVITTGTYTPTITNGTNVAASTSSLTNWQQNGNMVTVYFSFAIDATTTGLSTDFEVSLPVASNFAATTDCAGSAGSSTAIESWGIVGSIANDRAVFQGIVGTAANHDVRGSFMYKVI